MPACANSWLLDKILRKTWGYEGYVVSDCGAVEDVWLNHKYVPGPLQTTVVTLNAGLDLDLCGDNYNNIPGLVKLGKINESTVDESVKRVLSLR